MKASKMAFSLALGLSLVGIAFMSMPANAAAPVQNSLLSLQQVTPPHLQLADDGDSDGQMDNQNSDDQGTSQVQDQNSGNSQQAAPTTNSAPQNADPGDDGGTPTTPSDDQ